jgi:hypothetical protein
MERTMNKCTGMDAKLADLLLDPQSFDERPASAKAQSHVAQCASCRKDLEEMRATMALLDAWEAPEPSPYFLTRLDARLREERQAAPASWVARLRARFLYGSSMHVRPLAAMALTAMLLVGGGAYVGISNWYQPAAPNGQAAVVHDLQTLDNNAQLLDQLEEISSNQN